MPVTVTSLDELVHRIRRLSAERPVTVVGIAGYGGSGKSTLVRELLARLPGAARVRGDDLLDPAGSAERSDDWAALLRDELAAVLGALRGGRAATFRPVDWATGGRQGERTLVPAPIVLVDAVGLLHPALLPLLDLTVWVDVPLEEAMRRGMRRDRQAGDDHDALWREVWAPNERGFDARHRPRERADVRWVPAARDAGPITIEPYAADQREAVLELSLRAWSTVFPQTLEAVPGFVYDAFYPQGWEARQVVDLGQVLDDEPEHVDVALDHGTVVGWVCTRLHPEDSMGELYVLAVDPAHQRRGVGAALMEHAMGRAREAGMAIMLVETIDDPGHAPARASYEAAGFERWPVARYFKRLS